MKLFFPGGIPSDRIRPDGPQDQDGRSVAVRGRPIPKSPDHRQGEALARLLARRAELEEEYDALGAAAISLTDKMAELDRAIKAHRKGRVHSDARR